MCKKNNNEQDDKILTLKQVSRNLGIGTGPLRQWIRRGVLRPIKLIALPPCKYTHYKFTQEAVEAFLNENTVNHQELKHDDRGC